MVNDTTATIPDRSPQRRVRGESRRPVGPNHAWPARLKRAPVYAFAFALAALFILPLVWSASTALKPDNQLYLDPPRFIPSPVMWENFRVALQMAPFGKYLKNTLIITAIGGFGRVFVSTIIAYGFARFSFPGKQALFTALLSTMMIPYAVLLVPQFLMFNAMRWTNTILPLVVPAYLGGTPFMIFLGRQFIRSIPRELDQAAEIDGAGALATLTKIILPNCRAFLATATILSFQHDWNAFLGPLVYLQGQEKYTLALGLRYLAALGGGELMAGRPMEHYLMAATLAVAVPVVVIFLAFQRYFVQGVVMTGIKG